MKKLTKFPKIFEILQNLLTSKELQKNTKKTNFINFNILHKKSKKQSIQYNTIQLYLGFINYKKYIIKFNESRRRKEPR